MACQQRYGAEGEYACVPAAVGFFFGGVAMVAADRLLHHMSHAHAHTHEEGGGELSLSLMQSLTVPTATSDSKALAVSEEAKRRKKRWEDK